MEEFSASVSLGAKLFIKTKSKRGKFALVFSDPNNIKKYSNNLSKTKYQIYNTFSSELKTKSDEWFYIKIDENQKR